MKFLFCGDRNWNDIEYILTVMQVLQEVFGDFTVIEGEANGADSISRECAIELGLLVEKYPADWNKFHRAAGPIRNQQMLTEGNPDGVLAFHNDLKSSKGTKNMVDISMKIGLPVYISESSKLQEFIERVKMEKF